MEMTTRRPTLTGVAAGGVIIRPTPAAMSFGGGQPALRTLWICRVTLPPPIEGDIPQLIPTLLTLRVATPAPA